MNIQSIAIIFFTILLLIEFVFIYFLIKGVVMEELLEQEASGEATVEGDGEFIMEIGFHPKKLEVEFIDKPNHHCGGAPEDEVNISSRRNSITISYTTSEQRIIRWKAKKSEC